MSNTSLRYVDHTYRDYSRFIDEGGELIKHKKCDANFPSKVHRMLEDDHENSDVITWMPHGRAFKVLDKRLLIDETIPKYFVCKKYESFTRQLNGWGFKRLYQTGPDLGCYYHECFLRGLPRLTTMIRRLPPNLGKATPYPAGEPNFYRISERFPVPATTSSSRFSPAPLPAPPAEAVAVRASAARSRGDSNQQAAALPEAEAEAAEPPAGAETQESHEESREASASVAPSQNPSSNQPLSREGASGSGGAPPAPPPPPIDRSTSRDAGRQYQYPPPDPPAMVPSSHRWMPEPQYNQETHYQYQQPPRPPPGHNAYYPESNPPPSYPPPNYPSQNYPPPPPPNYPPTNYSYSYSGPPPGQQQSNYYYPGSHGSQYPTQHEYYANSANNYQPPVQYPPSSSRYPAQQPPPPPPQQQQQYAAAVSTAAVSTAVRAGIVPNPDRSSRVPPNERTQNPSQPRKRCPDPVIYNPPQPPRYDYPVTDNAPIESSPQLQPSQPSSGNNPRLSNQGDNSQESFPDQLLEPEEGTASPVIDDEMEPLPWPARTEDTKPAANDRGE